MRLDSVQVLRAVAASLVVLYHLTESQFFSGAAGVDIFFVISGVIMGTVGVSERPKQFIIRRIVRIVPLYWITTILFCVGSIAGIFTRFTFDLTSLTKSLFFIPYANQSGNIWPLVIAGWTLNVEVLFYLIFAIGILIGAPLRFASTTLLFLVISGIILAPDSAPMKLWTMPIVLEFAAGLVIARVSQPSSLWGGISMLVAGLAVFVWAEISWHYTELSRLLVWGGGATLIVWGALIIERSGYWPNNILKWISKIGDASYSMYMIHSFVVAAVLRKFGSGIIACSLGFPLCILAAFACFYGFERPVGRFLSKFTRNSSKLFSYK